MTHEQLPKSPESRELPDDPQVVVELESADTQTDRRKFFIRVKEAGETLTLVSGWWANRFHSDAGDIPVVESDHPNDTIGGPRVAYDLGSPALDRDSDDEAKKHMIQRVVGASAVFLFGAAAAEVLRRYLKTEDVSKDEQ